MRILFASAFVAAALFRTALPHSSPLPQAGDGVPERFEDLRARVAALSDSAARAGEIDAFIRKVRGRGGAWTEDSTATLLYRGSARRVFVAGDPNGWDPRADELTRLPGTDLFWRTLTLDPSARFEYKLIVDSAWVLDPLNPMRAAGGFGENSEVRMPGYRFPAEALPRSGSPHGEIDSIRYASRELGRSVRVLVYLPAAYDGSGERYPVLYVTDGGEYLTLAGMNVVLDNLIADGAITPLIAVFVDPRTDPDDPRTNARMSEYALNDRFVAALARELRPMLMNRYRMRGEAAQTGIMGASMGGLIATYAALTHPEVFGLCAAESPSYQWANDTLLTMLRSMPGGRFRMFLSTGTMHDAERRARLARDIMRARGYDVAYVETPEAHNWSNWRGRLRGLLTAFWGTR